MADLRTEPPRYGTLNLEYVDSWDDVEDTAPMWALNLMHYRERADYRDGRASTITGQEADDRYAPFGPLAAVGASVVLFAGVVEQLAGDDTTWDRIAVVRYPNRRAMREMEAMPDFQELHVHKDAGMKSTIVAATFPRLETIGSAVASYPESLLVLDVVADADAPEITSPALHRLAQFDIDGVIIGDGRRWAAARWYVVPASEVDALRASVPSDPTSERYVVVLRAFIDELARSTTN